MLEDVGNFISAPPFVVIRMDMKNQRSNMLIFPDAWAGFSREMFVISASVDPENAAERFNAVLEMQLMDGIWSLFECGVNMAIAFFKIRFSFSSWVLRF